MKLRAPYPSETTAVDLLGKYNAPENYSRPGLGIRTMFCSCCPADARAGRLQSDPRPGPEAKAEVKPPELLTGRAAFHKTFIAARNYAADVKPFRIESTPIRLMAMVWTASRRFGAPVLPPPYNMA